MLKLTDITKVYRSSALYVPVLNHVNITVDQGEFVAIMGPTNPDVILADQPTGALDTKSSEQVMDTFTAFFREGKTVILVTHEPDIASYAKRTIILRDGQIVEDRRK